MEKIKELLHSRRFWGFVGSIAVMAIIAVIYFIRTPYRATYSGSMTCSRALP